LERELPARALAYVVAATFLLAFLLLAALAFGFSEDAFPRLSGLAQTCGLISLFIRQPPDVRTSKA